MSQKRWLYFILISMFVVLGNGYVSFAAGAADKFEYTEENEVVTITKYTGSATTIDLGEEFPKAQEIILAENSFRDTSIIKITIPKNVTSIGSYAFEDCENLQTVFFEDRTAESLVFSHGVFCGCSNLLSLDIPDTVSAIPSRFADFCYSLGNVDLPSNCESIGEYAFDNCCALKSITIPAKCNTIGKRAFDECKLLAKVEFEERENTETEFAMGEYAFAYCEALTAIELPKGCKSLPAEVFNCCYNLTSVMLPDNCESIGAGAFYACSALSQMNSQEAGNLILPKNCKAIGRMAFSNCTSIKNMCIPLVCASLGEEAFRNCTNLNMVSFDNSDTSIGKDAFPSNKQAKNFTIYCDRVGSVTVYATTNNIAFSTSLLSITITNNPTKTEYYYEKNGKLDTTGMKIVAEYQEEDGKRQEEIIPGNCIFSAFESDKVGEQIITVSYGNKQTAFSVYVYYNLENALVEIDDTIFTGIRVQPSPIVNGKETGEKLVENTDYTFSCSDNINAGIATMKLFGKGVYKGEKTVSFKILPKTISEENTTISVEDMEYTGNQLKPTTKVVCGMEPLILDEDYVVTYGTNISVGNGFVIIEGIGNYEGSIKKWFQINASSESSGGNETGDKKEEGTTSESTESGTTESDGKKEEGTTSESTESGTTESDGKKEEGTTSESTESGTTESDGKKEEGTTSESTESTKTESNGNKDGGTVSGGNTTSASTENGGNTSGGTTSGNTASNNTGKNDSGSTEDTVASVKTTEKKSKKRPKKGKTYVCNNMYYKVTGSSTVTFMKPKKNVTEIFIPSTVSISGWEFKVTKINKKACYKNKKITFVVMGDNVTHVGEMAFAYCSNLKDITFGTGVTYIGKMAMYQDKKIKRVYMRKSLKIKTIKKYAFQGIKKSAPVILPPPKYRKYKKMINKSNE